MQLFIDWKVATNHWKPDCSIHGSWTPTAQHRIGPRHEHENPHKQPYVPDGKPALYISPSRFIRSQYWFHSEGEVSPTWSQEQAGGKTENTWHCNAKQDMQLCSSSGLSETGQRYKTSFNLKQAREAPSLWWIHRHTQTQLIQWRFVLLLPWRCMCGPYQFTLSPHLVHRARSGGADLAESPSAG